MKYYVIWNISADEAGRPSTRTREFEALTAAENFQKTINPSREPKILREYPLFDSLSDINVEINRLRTEILFGGLGDFEPDTLPPMAREFYFLLLNNLDSAGSNARLANYNNMQGR